MAGGRNTCRQTGVNLTHRSPENRTDLDICVRAVRPYTIYVCPGVQNAPRKMQMAKFTGSEQGLPPTALINETF